jgi:hypothetical protein
MATKPTPAPVEHTPHSPLPWHVRPWSGNPQVACVNKIIYEALDHTVTDEANAAFIVTACNSHAALYEALKDLHGTIDAASGRPDIDALRASIIRAEAALRLAARRCPAFPMPICRSVDGRILNAGEELHPDWCGMTLRDYFAAAALPVVAEDDGRPLADCCKELGIEVSEYKCHIHYPILMADAAYRIADAMLERRSKP